MSGTLSEKKKRILKCARQGYQRAWVRGKVSVQKEQERKFLIPRLGLFKHKFSHTTCLRVYF